MGAFLFRPSMDMRGQGCLYLDELKLFIGADLSWGVDLLPFTRQMRLIPSLVQDDKKAYLKGAGFAGNTLAGWHSSCGQPRPTRSD